MINVMMPFLGRVSKMAVKITVPHMLAFTSGIFTAKTLELRPEFVKTFKSGIQDIGKCLEV